MSSQKADRWDIPVFRALDRVEQLHGFAPDHVEWDQFVFGANGLHRPMDTASIYAFPSIPERQKTGSYVPSTSRHVARHGQGATPRRTPGFTDGVQHRSHRTETHRRLGDVQYSSPRRHQKLTRPKPVAE